MMSEKGDVRVAYAMLVLFLFIVLLIGFFFGMAVPRWW